MNATIRALLLIGCLGACAPAVPSPPGAIAPPGVLSAGVEPPGADSIRVDTLAPGVRHVYRWEPAGPWAINVVELQGGRCAASLHSEKAGERRIGRATTSEMAAAAQRRWSREVLAAVNADFFSFDPPGVPIGAHVSGGEIASGPGRRPVFGLTADGEPFIGTVRLRGWIRTGDGFAAPVAAVNSPADSGAIALFNRFAAGDPAPDTLFHAVRLRLLADGSRLGDTVRAVVQRAEQRWALAKDPGAEIALAAGSGRGAAFLGGVLADDDTVSLWLDLEPSPGPVREMVGGFPRLLRDGEHVVHLDEEVRPAFGDARHPRTAVGWRRDGTLLLLTVDGRQPPYSDGMSLGELADLMLRLGAVDALNLDGGGSTAMIVRGRVVNRPSDPGGERANANALVVLAPSAGAATDPRCHP